ncbi:DUF4013 domain-containing protein [Methanosarcina mazei]|uniref:DUF4013 domain-containing protein n=4 Tax=Methanosarcina mazei TaxID=2209 RepID=A0A0E3PUW4_METMZ|nr:DUF4013 domain-containing protein [Methanosarcina mazei]AKB40177.1 hypothetical protein MSMAW_1186 [Methanosarcina mazei WWM610]AKB61095.1 hypothetical protein MSMAP_1110 [Methanosarcina mazei SarPi]AKB67740.1 hypothetical protein MSMAL_1197 [Methanosarcina mazei LYC]AKB72445.1 hypothetical protein MSMAC_2555 [Methanosarcina mazei C16]MDO5840111.1 DUF4013 domain-containing protein [Methanosarcina mazei]
MIIIETISFSEAFKYPFKTPKRLLYALLIFVPIIGWLALFGYGVRLVNEFIEGRYEGPIKLDFMEDLKFGFMVFLKSLPFYIIYIIILFAAMYVSEGLGNIISLLLGFFVVPMLAVNFFRKQTVESFFEFSVLNVVRDNLGEYIITVLKQYALVIIFMVLSIVLVGIPGMLFTNSIFVANMYGRLVERKAEASL